MKCLMIIYIIKLCLIITIIYMPTSESIKLDITSVSCSSVIFPGMVNQLHSVVVGAVVTMHAVACLLYLCMVTDMQHHH